MAVLTVSQSVGRDKDSSLISLVPVASGPSSCLLGWW